jgi:phosphate transport system permease protein
MNLMAKNQRPGRIMEWFFHRLCLLAILLPIVGITLLIVKLVILGAPRLNWVFVTSFPSRYAHLAGIWPGMIGTVYILLLTATLAVPIGVGAAVFLEEYRNVSPVFAYFSGLIEINIANLASVPSVIYGMLGLSVFVRYFSMGAGVLAASMTLALLVLPVIILATRESLRSVPHSLREAAWGMGATRLSTIRYVVLPMATPGILTGTILALSRAIGETAPLVVIGAVGYVGFLPQDLSSPFTALPIQIFNWVSRPQPEFVANAAGGIIVLLLMLLVLNSIALYIKNRVPTQD